jgi:hypothetical protein
MAENRGFSSTRDRLQALNLLILERQLPKVSGHVREYSRFAETTGGDRFRYVLRGSPYSPFDHILGPSAREIGGC